MSLSKTPYPLLNTRSTQEEPCRHDRKKLTGMYRIKSNVHLAQLQRNRAGECLHKSLASVFRGTDLV